MPLLDVSSQLNFPKYFYKTHSKSQRQRETEEMRKRKMNSVFSVYRLLFFVVQLLKHFLRESVSSLSDLSREKDSSSRKKNQNSSKKGENNSESQQKSWSSSSSTSLTKGLLALPITALTLCSRVKIVRNSLFFLTLSSFLSVSF